MQRDPQSQNQQDRHSRQTLSSAATNQSHHQNASYRNSTSLSQSRHQFFSTAGNGNNLSQLQQAYPYRYRPTDVNNLNPADSMMMGVRNQNNLLSQSNILQTQNQILLSPSQLDDQNRLFAFHSPQEHDIYSPQAFTSNNSMSHIFQMMGSQSNPRNVPSSSDDIGSSGGLHREILQHQLDVMQHLQSQKEQKKQGQQRAQLENEEYPNEAPQVTLTQEKPETEKDMLDKRLKNYSSIVMQQTFFNHLSLQVFFVLVLIMIIYELHYSSILIFLWVADIISFSYSFQRSRIEVEVDPSKQDDMNNLWRILETFFSIIFKVCLYIYMEVDHYKFYYVPCSLLIYVLIRFFFVISKKLTENGPISSLLNESFTWGFKIFFVGQLFLISIKIGDKIDWTWQDVFWPYWVFFYIMIGTNSVFVILLLSKVLLKCLGQPVESFEIKGLFWFFMLSNGLCVNSTLFVRGIISYLDLLNQADALKAFKYSVCFICTFVVYTLLFWKGILQNRHLREREDQEGDNSMRNDSRMRSSRIKHRNKTIGQSEITSKQSQPTGDQPPNGEEGDEDQDEEYDDGDDEDDEEEIYAQGMYPDGDYENNGVSDRQQSQQGRNSQNTSVQPRKKTFKKEKLSSTYFTVFTNNGMKKMKKDGNNNEQNKSKSINKSRSITTKKQNGYQPNKGSKQLAPNAINKSDIQSGGQKKKKVISQKEKLEQIQFQIDSPKGLSDSLRNVEISFNDAAKKIEPPKEKNSLSKIAYDTQMKFSQLILSPKGQELKKKELEKKNLEAEFKNEKSQKPKEQSNHKATPSAATGEQSCEESNVCCVICYENEPDTVYLPCGHGGICYECGMDVIRKTGECYLCRNEIQQVVQIDVKSKDTQKKVIAVTSALEEKTDCNDSDNTISNNIHPNVSVAEIEVENQQPMRQSYSNMNTQEQDMQLEPAIYGGRQEIAVQQASNLESDQNQQLNSISFEAERKKIEYMAQLQEDQNVHGVLFSSGREDAHSEKKCISSQIEQRSDQYLVNLASNDQ